MLEGFEGGGREGGEVGYVNFVRWEVGEDVCCCHCGGLLVAVDEEFWR